MMKKTSSSFWMNILAGIIVGAPQVWRKWEYTIRRKLFRKRGKWRKLVVLVVGKASPLRSSGESQLIPTDTNRAAAQRYQQPTTLFSIDEFIVWLCGGRDESVVVSQNSWGHNSSLVDVKWYNDVLWFVGSNKITVKWLYRHFGFCSLLSRIWARLISLLLLLVAPLYFWLSSKLNCVSDWRVIIIIIRWIYCHVMMHVCVGVFIRVSILWLNGMIWE